MTEPDIATSDFLWSDPERSFTPCAFYNTSMRTLSVFLHDTPSRTAALTPHETDIFFGTEPPLADVFVGFQLWCDVPLVIYSIWKQEYCSVSKKDVFRADDCAVLTTAIKKHNEERRLLRAKYIVECLLDECPDVAQNWGIWHTTINETLDTYPLEIHIPL